MYSEGDLKRLVDLGMPEKTARAALEDQRGDVAKAADFVLSGRADKEKSESKSRRLGWKYTGKRDRESKDNSGSTSSLPVPLEGRELSYNHPLSVTSPPPAVASSASSTAPSSGLPSRSSSTTSISSGPPTRPTTPSLRWSNQPSLTRDELDQQASRLVLGVLERTTSAQQGDKDKDTRDRNARSSTGGASGSFSRRSLTSMMTGFSLRSNNDDKERGRSEKKDKDNSRARSSSYGASRDDESDGGSLRARSQSPFRFRRQRRDSSPTVEALSQSDVESDAEPTRIRPRNAFTLSGQSDDESDSEDDDESDEDEWDEATMLDPVTSRNTERNALIPADMVEPDTTDVPDPLGEGVNVVIAPEPYFPSTLNATGNRNPRRRKSTRVHDTLHLETSRPHFQRDRCTITLTHGDPAKTLEDSHRRPKRYVLASDLSEESRYALEWGIGTVLRDGDEMLIVTVVENEAKIDPTIPSTDRASKLRSQQERQAMAYILVRQATSLLQRTRLHVTIACQAWHAKNARHMLLDIVDYIEPTMLIVGSRGLGNLKGILLGSTSHYLIQKCSVPVMVARRRLKRPPRRSAHLATHRARVSLAQAGIDRVAPKVDQDVAVMREQVERDDDRRDEEGTIDDNADDDPDTEVEGDATPPLGRKVPGTVD